MSKLSLLLNIMAVVCVVWGDLRGYQTHEHGMALARAQMRVRYEQCAVRVRASTPDESDRLRQLRLKCSESLDEERWMPSLTHNLLRDSAMAGAPLMFLALALAILGFLAPRFGASRVPKRKPGVS